MKTFSELLALCAGIHRSSVNSPHKGQWSGALMFSLICAWINGWVNNREAGDLRCHGAHYDVTVMKCQYSTLSQSVTIYFSHNHNDDNKFIREVHITNYNAQYTCNCCFFVPSLCITHPIGNRLVFCCSTAYTTMGATRALYQARYYRGTRQQMCPKRLVLFMHKI